MKNILALFKQIFGPEPNNHAMKKLIAFLFLACFATSSFTQSTGDLENQFYIRLGLSQPTKSYFDIDNRSEWNDISRIGGGFELGSIYMFNSLPLADGLRIGLNVDYLEFTYHHFKFTSYDYNWSQDASNYIHVLKLTSNIGPSISYSPVTDLVLDAFVKIKSSWFGYINDYIEFDHSDYLGYFGIGYKIGFNVRYRILMAGFEFSTDKMKFEDDDEATSLPCFNVTFGLSF